MVLVESRSDPAKKLNPPLYRWRRGGGLRRHGFVHMVVLPGFSGETASEADAIEDDVTSFELTGGCDFK